MFAQRSLQKIRGPFTEKRYRRIQMYCEGVTYREIAAKEGVSFQNICKSFMAEKENFEIFKETG